MNAPKRILIVKTSSLGDLIHNFPMVSDIGTQFPTCKIDWLVEENYIPLVRLHLGVERIIPIALRRWRKSIFSASTWTEIKDCIFQIRKYRYDLIIDSQGLLKSAVFALLAKGLSCGFGPRYSREKLAGMTYNLKISVSREQHMLNRCRQLASLALKYPLANDSDYGLIKQNSSVLKRKNVIIFCSSAQSKKLWPTADWIRVCNYLRSNDFNCQFTWGSPDEKRACEHIISLSAGELLVKMPIDDLAMLISQSCLVVGLDTGLLHLAAALEVPSIAIFGASDPLKTGPRGSGVIKICGSKNRFPTAEEVKANINNVIETIN
ncbi:lipopolysaccharide heptosyltransferase I [Burkholderiales bacterium]|nr:lipopolysaccharide heptosyltransferase I [Burkholderiales bacterium]